MQLKLSSTSWLTFFGAGREKKDAMISKIQAETQNEGNDTRNLKPEFLVVFAKDIIDLLLPELVTVWGCEGQGKLTYQ